MSETTAKISKNEIKPILEKETLTYWDVKCIFQYVDQALDGKKSDAGLNYFSSVSTQVQEDVEWAIIKTKQIAESIVKLENSIIEQLDKSYEQIESKFTEYTDKVYKLQRKCEEFKITLPSVQVPYGYGDLFSMLEKLSYMDENKRAIFFELVEKLSNQNAANNK